MIKRAFIFLLVVAGFGFGVWQAYLEDYKFVSKIGMDDFGRQGFCQSLNLMIKSRDDVHIYCAGGTSREFLFSLDTASPILFGAFNIHDIEQNLEQPFKSALVGISGLVISGDEGSGDILETLEIDELVYRLEKIGVDNIADMYAAFGFNKFFVRVEDTGSIYLEVFLSDSQFGENPLSQPPK